MVGLTPGRYEFRLGEGENQQVAEFIIPEKFEGFVQLGPIVLKRKTARINKIEAEDFSGMKKSTK